MSQNWTTLDHCWSVIVWGILDSRKKILSSQSEHVGCGRNGKTTCVTLTSTKCQWSDEWAKTTEKDWSLWGAPGQQRWYITDSGLRRDTPWSAIQEGWSKPTEGRLWHNSQKFFFMVIGRRCHNTHTADQTECPWSLFLHHQMHIQWGHKISPLEQWKKVDLSDESHSLLSCWQSVGSAVAPV